MMTTKMRMGFRVFKYSLKECKNQFVTAGRLVTVLDMRPSTTNTLTNKRATKITAHIKTTLLLITRMQLTGQDGKRAQTLIATMTPTSPDAHGNACGLVAQTIIRTGHHAQDNDPL